MVYRNEIRHPFYNLQWYESESLSYIGQLRHSFKNQIFPGLFMPLQPEDFDPSHPIFFRRLVSSSTTLPPITFREIIMRLIFVPWWLHATISRLDAIHTLLSLIAVVILRYDDYTMWPPIFGSLSNASSMRNFWGKFWHRILMRPYENYSRLFCRSILRLRPGSA